MSRSQKIILGLAGVVLFAGLGLVVIGARPPPERTFKGAVKDLLPDPELVERAGWTVEYQPIADTPEMKAKVTELLNYDDAEFAVYKNGTERISVYIAFWVPGKMSTRLVAGHTPDVCWINSGWSCEAWSSGIRLTTEGWGALPPAEQRTMTLHGNTEHVVFWHLLDGVPMNYGTRGNPPWYSFLTDMLDRRMSQRPEQWFVRISSNRPVSTWQDSTVMARLWSRLNPAVSAASHP